MPPLREDLRGTGSHPAQQNRSPGIARKEGQTSTTLGPWRRSPSAVGILLIPAAIPHDKAYVLKSGAVTVLHARQARAWSTTGDDEFIRIMSDCSTLHSFR